jgi:hypothetical protein
MKQDTKKILENVDLIQRYKTASPLATTLAPKLMDRIIYLYERWQDEKEYEDFKDYEKNIQELFEKENTCSDLTFKRATKRPFGIELLFEKKILISLSISGNKYRTRAKVL